MTIRDLNNDFSISKLSHKALFSKWRLPVPYMEYLSESGSSSTKFDILVEKDKTPVNADKLNYYLVKMAEISIWPSISAP